jgi:hypothetical protein
MSMLDQNALERIANVIADPCVSIYLPTHPKGLDYRKDPIRLKNLLRDAETQLEAIGMERERIQAFLEPASKLLEDDLFWKHQSDGLAVFMTQNGMERFRLPLRFSELAVVNRRFHIKPLLPLLSLDGRFWLLTLSQNRVRLFDGSREALHELDMKSIPASLQDALGYDWEQSSLQFRASGAPGASRTAFYGGGEGREHAKEEITAFFRLVDDGIRALIGDSKAPIVLAAVDYEIAIYRQITKLPHVLEQGIAGNPESLDAGELHRRGWELVAPHFDRAREMALERYGDLSATERTSTDLQEVLGAAHDGRIETLFVALGVRRWGRYDAESRSVEEVKERGPGVEDLLDLAAAQAFARGGTVHAVAPEQLPVEGPLAAIYRY